MKSDAMFGYVSASASDHVVIDRCERSVDANTRVGVGRRDTWRIYESVLFGIGIGEYHGSKEGV